jgi:predicted Zn finger-like uncharacterized protein
MHSSNFSYGSDRSRVTASDTTPTVCPACQSNAIVTMARNPNENAYWRCRKCGEIWNAARRAASGGGARWR